MQTVYVAHWARYDDWQFVGVFSDMNRAKIAADEHGRQEWLERLQLFRDGHPEFLLEIFTDGPSCGGAVECKVDEVYPLYSDV